MATHPPTGALNAAKIEALTNGRYHGDREAFLLSTHRALIAAVIIFGASAVTDAFWPWAKGLAALATVVMGTLDLTFSLVERSRDHAIFRERYFDIAKDLEKASASVPVAMGAMRELSGKEPPPYRAVHALAENWATTSVLGTTAAAPCIVGDDQKRWRHFRRFEEINFAA